MLKVSAIRLDTNNEGKAIVELVPLEIEADTPGYMGSEGKVSRLVNLNPEDIRGLTVGDRVEDLIPTQVFSNLTD